MQTIKLYSVSELKENFKDGFENALKHWQDDTKEIFWMDETIESLKAIVEASGLYLRNYSIGAYCQSYIVIDWPFSIAELNGNRALAWLENNLLCDLRELRPFNKRLTKYEKWHSYRRYGKIPACPFTGYFADDVYLKALIKAVKQGHSLKESYSYLADECQKLLEVELDDQMSEEYFINHAESNEYTFTENGQRVY